MTENSSIQAPSEETLACWQHTLKRMKNHVGQIQAENNSIGLAVDLDTDIDRLEAIASFLESAATPAGDSTEVPDSGPVGYVERRREFEFDAAPVLTRVINYDGMYKLPHRTQLFAGKPPQAVSLPVRTGKHHELKTDSAVFEQSVRGLKPWEVRRNDRDFRPGDTVTIRETRFSGEEMAAGSPLEFSGRE